LFTRKERRLKILHVSSTFAPAWVYGGPTESTYQLCRHLGGAGCLVRVLTTDANGLDQVLRVNTQAEVEFAPKFTVRYCHRVLRHSVSPKLVQLLREYVCWADVVHLTTVYAFPIIPTLVACRLTSKPVMWSPRGVLQRWSGSRRPTAKLFWERICKNLAPKNMTLHVTSNAEARESAGRLGEKRIVVIPNGVVVPDKLGSRIPGEKNQLRLLYLGRLDPKKGIENLLAACRLLLDDHVSFKLTIAGTGEPSYEDSLRARIVELRQTSTVSLIGDVRGGIKEEVFQQSDALVMPSFTENFGMAVAEALARGVPVIASRSTPWSDVERVGCGLWVNNDSVSLAGAIRLANTMPLESMGLRGRDWMTKEFSWNPIALRMIQAYVELLSDARGPAVWLNRVRQGDENPEKYTSEWAETIVRQ
jgi:glycosyltransferase involved in cell wall biosynthesis